MQTATASGMGTRRVRGFLTVLGVLAGLMVAAPAALATIVVGQGIAGVKLGDSEAQVKQVLGKPSSICSTCNSSTPNEWWYNTGRIGRNFFGPIDFDSTGHVMGMFTGSGSQMTSKGIHPELHGPKLIVRKRGSSLAEVRRAYPHVMCDAPPKSQGYAMCQLTSHYLGRKVITTFTIQSTRTGVDAIEIDFATE